MNVYLPRNLFPQIHEDPTVNPASRRKVVLPRIARQLLEGLGYQFGAKIRVPGGYAFEVTNPSGKAVRLGLKTAVNRWLNTAPALVERVDVVIIATFMWDDGDEQPISFELIEIQSKALLEMIDKVKKAAVKRGWDRDGHYYMPLDASVLGNEEDHVGCVAGAVIPAGRVVFGPEQVIWVDDEWGSVGGDPSQPQRIVSKETSDIPKLDVTRLVAETKLELAGKLGISSERIDVSIRF
jgi:hypothetical protein